MENVEVKEEKKASKKVSKKVSKKKSNAGLVAFMEDRNAKRAAMKLKPAYSKEEIEAYK